MLKYHQIAQSNKRQILIKLYNLENVYL